MKEGIEIIKDDTFLQCAFKYIIENNTSNYLPYHNLNHLLTVLKYSDFIAQGELVYYDKRLPLHLAALFHDVNHSGGKEKDSVNIENAKNAFIDFIKNTNTTLNNDDINIVLSLIEVTEYPYVTPNSNITPMQKIIRDADMMQAFEYNWINQTTLGIAAENNIPIKTFIPKQRLFLESISYLTNTAEDLKKSRWANVMNEFRILEKSMGL